jgi:hypothetical protein
MPTIGTKRILKSHKKDDILSNLESMSADWCVSFAGPWRIRDYPINPPLVPEKISPFANLAPVPRFWEGVVKRPSRSTAWIKTEAARLKIRNNLPRKCRGGFHIIRLRAK